MFADDTVLLTEDEWEQQGLVSEFGNVCNKLNLKINATMSKILVFERKKH